MSKVENDDSELNSNEDNYDDPKRSDFVKISSDVISCLNIKVAFFIFLLGMILFSDVFIDNVLNKIPDTVQSGSTTTKGTIIQIAILSTSYIFIDLLVQKKWL
jgi:hypothetical protein